MCKLQVCNPRKIKSNIIYDIKIWQKKGPQYRIYEIEKRKMEKNHYIFAVEVLLFDNKIHSLRILDTYSIVTEYGSHFFSKSIIYKERFFDPPFFAGNIREHIFQFHILFLFCMYSFSFSYIIPPILLCKKTRKLSYSSSLYIDLFSICLRL